MSRSAPERVFFLMGAELFLLPPLLTTIAADLHVGAAATAWVLTSYVLTYALTSPPLAALSDRFGRREVILTGVAIFAFGDLACALAPTLTLLVVAHAVSGLGGALAAPAILAYLGETATPDERGRAVSRGAAMYAAGQIVGVPLGVLLATSLGWR
ncbi:MAG: MFS transporter [Actinomycetota bacterium]|nr:MFS transporter [Actinomycetota bacterium]